MNYQEEQQTEIEALMSIYPEEIKLLSETDPVTEFEIQITPFSVETETEVNHVAAILRFNYPPNYPDELPGISVYSKKGLLNKDLDELKKHIDPIAEEYKGSVMIFAIVSGAQEWLLQHNDLKELQQKQPELSQSTSAAEAYQILDKLKEEKQRESMKLDRFTEDKDFIGKPVTYGTTVTKENFYEWKLNFDEEMKKLKEKNAKTTKKFPGECSGREWFEKRATKFLDGIADINEGDQASGEDVMFDEDLFLDDAVSAE